MENINIEIETLYNVLNRHCIQPHQLFDWKVTDRSALPSVGTTEQGEQPNPLRVIPSHTTRKQPVLSKTEQKLPLTEINGSENGDFPTRYKLQGLTPWEIPVIGTFIDRRVLPGFKYTVRRIGTQKYIFDKPLTLCAIGKGFGKRVTFQSDSFNSNENYFYSDSWSEGLAFSLCVIEEGNIFEICDSESRPVGGVTIQAIHSQCETSTTCDKEFVEKTVPVTFICDISFGAERHGMMALHCSQPNMLLSGVAIATKSKGSKSAFTSQITNVKIPNIGDCTLFAPM